MLTLIQYSSSTALIVGPGLQTLFAQITEHEITIPRGAVVMELEERSELRIDQQRKHWASQIAYLLK
jgi:hypothetical protein